MAQKDVLEVVRKVTKRETINGTSFSPGDYVIRVGRYFDKDPSDDASRRYGSKPWRKPLYATGGGPGAGRAVLPP